VNKATASESGYVGSKFGHEPRASRAFEWYTPPHIFTALGLVFDLDPCSAGEGEDGLRDFVPALRRYTVDDDGLVQDWQGMVWCNPPYGTQTGAWLRKMKEHNNGIALVFARTGTRWWQEVVPSSHTVCFIHKRIRFINGQTGSSPSTAGADSALIAWGEVAGEAVYKSKLGICMRYVNE
jgi:hypothetical protein